MPDGRTHLALWALGSGGALISSAVIATSYDPVLAAGVMSGYLLGRYVGPDLDLVGINKDESRAMRELKLLGVLTTMWFLPYAYIMRFVGLGRKGHRNFFSHFPVVGTIIRLAWLFSPLLGALWYWKPGFLQQEFITPLAIGLLAGNSYTDLIHYIADLLGNKVTKLIKS